MKNVLIITHDFAPLGGGGVMRTVKFVKYLPQFGWMPTVITADIPIPESAKDYALLEELNEKVQIYRTRAPEKFGIEKGLIKKANSSKISKGKFLLRILIIWKWVKDNIQKFFFIPDRCALWIPFAYKKCKEIVKSKKIDVIYTTSPPVSAHMIGYLLKGRTKIPWVMDFRDLWFDHIVFGPKNKYRKWIERWLEKRFIKNADHIITVTDSMKENILLRHPKESSKITTISNGYDAEIFERATTSPYINPKKLTITYTGSLQNYQTPEYFLKALKDLITKKGNLKNEIEIIFAGTMQDKYQKIFGYPPLSEIVHYVGFLSYQESVNLLCSSDISLLIIYEELGGASFLTGKLFDYIAAKKPILALVPEGIAADFIRSEKLGAVVQPKNVKEIKFTLEKFYSMWKKNKHINWNVNENTLELFTRKNLTQKLRNILEKIRRTGVST